MKRKRLVLIVSLMLVFVFILTFSSTVFTLKSVEICFINDSGQTVSLDSNKIYSTQSKLDEILSSVNFNYGELLFLLDKDKYINQLESNNPYFKVIGIEAIFPNKFLVKAQERKDFYYFEVEDEIYLLDKDFKILDIAKNFQNLSGLIEINFESMRGYAQNFFEFFELSSLALESGFFITQNNLVFSALNNLYDIILSVFDFEFLESVTSLLIVENGEDNASLILNTSSPFGITLEVENLLNDFDTKMTKLLNALMTLKNKERIKTTYGRLKIDSKINCYWYNL